MSTSSFKKSVRGQRGAALLVAMLIVMVGVATVLVATVKLNDAGVRRLAKTKTVLDEARQALLDYALVSADIYGELSLPCPDLDDGGGLADGEAHATTCGSAGETMIGRLPWRTLGTPALKDASEACLWYVVSGSWKAAGSASSPLINVDTNGQLQVIGIESGSVFEGLLPQDRPVALVIAGMRPLPGQSRTVAGPTGCAPGADVADYLDRDVGTGVSNAELSGSADTIDAFAVSTGSNDAHNDRIVTISRQDIARRIVARADIEPRMRELGIAIAQCIADYGAGNPGGAEDARLPWPAPVALPDYRYDSAYDDIDGGFLSGRLADRIDDSSAATGNAIARLLSDCDASVARRWARTKDHWFYAVAPEFSPAATVPTACADCLTVNGTGRYAAVLMYSNVRLEHQVRNAPPLDTDTKNDARNYLEASNADNVPGTSTAFESIPASSDFNDRLFCIDERLTVTEC